MESKQVERKKKHKKKKHVKKSDDSDVECDDELLRSLKSQGLNDRQIYDELIKRGESVVVMDHIATQEEIHNIGHGMSNKKLVKKITENYENDNLEEFIAGLVIDYYKKNCRLGDLSLLDK
jgi:hypothetical protein